jgi:hypothetical protein
VIPIPRILKDLVISEVSSVDRGAGHGVQVVLMKRDETQERQSMTLIERVKKSNLSRAGVAELLRHQVRKLAKPGERFESAFDRCITTDDECKALFKIEREMGLASSFAEADHHVALHQPMSASGQKRRSVYE